MKRLIIPIPIIFFISYSAYSQPSIYDSLSIARIHEIRTVLDTGIFVNRMETVETPCMCIDMNNDKIAYANRETINSNYRVQLAKDSTIDSSGIKCLSQYVSRYIKFHVDTLSEDSLIMCGKVWLSYAYPAGSLMQYLGFTNGKANRTRLFFDQLISSKGEFCLYPENNRLIIRMHLPEGPYNSYTMYGYLEIVREAYRDTTKSFRFYFDRLAIEKGNNNNSVSVKFSNTSHMYESEYFSVFAYHILKYKDSNDKSKQAYAVWFRNYLEKTNCPNLSMFLKSAEQMIKRNTFSLPNTEPLPVN